MFHNLSDLNIDSRTYLGIQYTYCKTKNLYGKVITIQHPVCMSYFQKPLDGFDSNLVCDVCTENSKANLNFD
jgi:hypothetical protein